MLGARCAWILYAKTYEFVFFFYLCLRLTIYLILYHTYLYSDLTVNADIHLGALYRAYKIVAIKVVAFFTSF